MLKIKDEDFPAYIEGLIDCIEKYDHIKYHYINKPGANDSNFRLCQTMVCTNDAYTIKKKNLSSEGLPFKYIYTLDSDLKNSLHKMVSFMKVDNGLEDNGAEFFANMIRSRMTAMEILES